MSNDTTSTTSRQGQIAAPTLDDFAALPRWVAWRQEWRQNKNGEWHPTKIPFDPKVEQQARVPTDPSTWGTREQAEAAWHGRYEDGQTLGGIGIVLGKLDDGRLLMGIDLDNCIEDNGDFKPWAVDVLMRFNSYAEVSPSGSGAKQFFLVAGKDIAAVQLLIKNNGKLTTRRTFVAAKHHEIAVDTARFYAVTGNQVLNLPATLRTVGVDAVRWFIEQAGPAYLKQHGGNGGGQQRTRDESGSGYGFRFMRERKASGSTYEQACAAIRADPGAAGEWAGRSSERDLRRAWDNAPNRDAAGATLDIVRMSTIRLEAVRWIWPNRLARGKVTIMSGMPFLGKSHIAIDAAARITRGMEWPDSTEGESYAPLGSVLMLSAEDAAKDTTGPRLKVANADMDRIDVVRMVTERDGSRRLFKLQTDLQLLTAKISELRDAGSDVVLFIIDPISAYMGEKEGNTITSFRPVLSQLAEFAESNDVAVLAIHHPPKTADNAMHAFSGSLAFIAAPRIGFVVTKEEGSDRRLMLAVGSNISAQAEGLGFYIVEHMLNLTAAGGRLRGRIKTTRLEWDRRAVAVSASEALRAASGKERAPRQRDAAEFLATTLRTGAVDQLEVLEAAAAQGISKRTLYRAKEKLKVRSVRNTFDGGWSWRLPPRNEDEGGDRATRGLPREG
jgi:putative DNA primase/helicase